ncbi:phage antirepressor KilAC domain-containing protein [Komagataeibacter sp. FNDCR1]|nr:phage antirepressor KilAC domain-containing protein [Komagataeibacter sp. FNDCR1]
MTNAPTLFRFEGKPLNVQMDGSGDITFNAGDVCRVLELAHVASALRILDEDEKGVRDEHTLGGNQKVSFVTEPGLYKLISRSRKEAAKRFDRWVRHEVLPTIRKTGSFAVKPMDESEIVARAFQITHKQLEEAKQEIATLTPKADGFDRLANTIGRTNLREVGKALQIGSKRGIEFLRLCCANTGKGIPCLKPVC